MTLLALPASLLVLGGLALGMLQVSGTYDSEDFSCGSAFVPAGGDSGYEATTEYASCDHSRRILLIVSLGALGLGFGVGGVAYGMVARCRSQDRGQVA